MTLTITGCSRFNGQNLTDGNQSWQVKNPADLSVTLDGTFYSATPAEVRAIQRTLRREGLLAMRKVTPAQFKQFVETWAQLFGEHQEAIFARASAENSRSVENWYRVAEAPRMIGQAKAIAEAVQDGNWKLPMILTSGGTPFTPDVRRIYEPYGAATMFGANNFDLAFGGVGGGNTWAALATGNPVLIVGNRNTPGSNELQFQVLEMAAKQSGFPLEALGFIHSGTEETAFEAVKGVDIVGHTGGYGFGRRLEEVALSHHTEFRGEWSGPNGLYICDSVFDSDWKTPLDGAYCALEAKHDFCTCYGFVVVTEANAEAVIGRLREKAEAATLRQMLSLDAARGYAARVDAYRTAGVEWIGMGKDEPDLKKRAASRVMIGRIDGSRFLEVCAEHNLADQPFGPSTVVISVKNETDFADVGEALGGSLCSTLWCDEADVERLDETIFLMERHSGRRQRGIGKVPQGVRVSRPMVHGGKRPAASSATFTSVSPQESLLQFLRPVCYEAEADGLRPQSVQNTNHGCTLRWIDGTWTKRNVG